jgi:CHAT domain-containing protein
MDAFYENLLLDEIGPAEALRAAQIELLRRNRQASGHARPTTWGAFTHSGAWRPQAAEGLAPPR